MTVRYRYPDEWPRTEALTLRADGEPVDVLATASEPFARFGADGPVACEFAANLAFPNLRPSRYGIAMKGMRFTLPGPGHFALFDGDRPALHLWVDGPERAAPAGARVYRAGRLYDEGEIRLDREETLWIEGGAVVRGWVRATDADGVRIGGHGVLDGGYTQDPDGFARHIVIEGSRGIGVEDVAMIHPCGWMLTLGRCEDARVARVKQIGTRLSSDGVDVNGSSRVRIEDCYLRNGDDCVVVKSLDLRAGDPTVRLDHTADVSDVTVKGCVLTSFLGGNAMEIGHELRCRSVRGVRFEDVDVLAKHGYGAVFSIHNGDHARVEDVEWRNVRVEHHYDKLVDLRVMRSRYSRTEERGTVYNVRLQDIEVRRTPFLAGYTVSLIGGYDADHRVEDVRFERFRYDGEPITSPDELDLFTRHADGITFME